ncbi:hypothetical protein E5676_scaffold1185G00430 [Cucumis melo var. makuwa]|uniref:Uncharacterized protein n=1 Tax=Cucumis melo var. makuwa TaxID=1194695 RepID=A0A5A7VJU1_CUCMM|nr:hypothetical protein E6C27_scaffold238G00560 [Cucumis melo var. makuwa]TYK26080.1 hypothetical protein E5676_scaffold1185G00430 [Cucumis melo var. makuwa]
MSCENFLLKVPFNTDPYVVVKVHLLFGLILNFWILRYLESTPLSTFKMPKGHLIAWHPTSKYIAFNITHLAYLHGPQCIMPLSFGCMVAVHPTHLHCLIMPWLPNLATRLVTIMVT